MGEQEIRTKSVKFLTDSITSGTQDSDSFNAEAASKAAFDLELAIFQAHDTQSKDPYRQDIRSKGLALKQNQQLSKALLDGQVTGKQVAEMSEEQLKTQARAAEDFQLRLQGLQNSMGLPETHEQIGPPLNLGADNISGSEPDPLTGVQQDIDNDGNLEFRS